MSGNFYDMERKATQKFQIIQGKQDRVQNYLSTNTALIYQRMDRERLELIVSAFFGQTSVTDEGNFKYSCAVNNNGCRSIEFQYRANGLQMDMKIYTDNGNERIIPVMHPVDILIAFYRVILGEDEFTKNLEKTRDDLISKYRETQRNQIWKDTDNFSIYTLLS